MSLIKLIIMLYCKLFSIKISRTFSIFRITKYNTLSPKKKRQCKQPNTTQLNIYNLLRSQLCLSKTMRSYLCNWRRNL